MLVVDDELPVVEPVFVVERLAPVVEPEFEPEFIVVELPMLEPEFIEPELVEPPVVEPEFIEPEFIEPVFVVVEPEFIEPEFIEPVFVVVEPVFVVPVLLVLLPAVFVFAVSQAIPIAPKTNIAERAKVFFILITNSPVFFKDYVLFPLDCFLGNRVPTKKI